MEIALNNFNIDDSFSAGSGNTSLLNDLMSPETASANPSDVTAIIKEVEIVTEEDKAKKKEIINPNSLSDKSEQEVAKSTLSDFLSDNSENDDAVENEEDNKDIKNESSKKENILEKDKSNVEVSKFSALSKDLFKLGVFNKEEDEADVDISSPEDFLERFQSEKKKGANEIVENFIGQFGEDYQNAFQAIFVNGADPKQYFSAYNEVVDYSQMDMTIEENQKSVMRQALLNQEYEQEDIETEIERLINYGDLENVSVKHHKILVKRGAAKLQEIQEQADVQLKQKTAQKTQYINNVKSVLSEKLKTKEFDGIPLNLNLANELQDFLLVDKWKTPSGETLTDFDRVILDLKKPENHSQKVKIAMLLKMIEKDPSLSVIQKTGITKQTNQLFSEVARQVTTGNQNTSSGSTSKWAL